jgi:two-component system sensor histidine kinase EvgS
MDLGLSVTDTGIGIPEGDIDRIFESFEQRTDQDTGLYGGTGLGLAISRRLVEMMNGKLWAESRVDQGSTFYILIRDVKPSSDAVPPPPAPFSPHLIQFEPVTVLVTDDMESQRALLSSLLSQVNLTPVMAGNGREAIDRAQTIQPALILMDIRMPEMDGITAVQHLKSETITRHIPIIAITASSTDANAFTDKGFDDYLPKPIDIDALMTVLTRHLKIRSMAAPDACPSAGDLSPQVLSRLPAVLRILENEVMDRWEALRHQQPMDAVKAFGEQIQGLGRDHGLDMLSSYGEDLIFHVEAFDVAQMQAALDAFPMLIQTIKTLAGDTHDA